MVVLSGVNVSFKLRLLLQETKKVQNPPIEQPCLYQDAKLQHF
jgi:hypothetical protein